MGWKQGWKTDSGMTLTTPGERNTRRVAGVQHASNILNSCLTPLQTAASGYTGKAEICQWLLQQYSGIPFLLSLMLLTVKAGFSLQSIIINKCVSRQDRRQDF